MDQAERRGSGARNADGFLCTNRCKDRKSTRLNSSHSQISYAVFCLKKKTTQFFPCIATILFFLLYPRKYIGTRYCIVAGMLYLLAKFFEFSDEMMFSAGNVLG